jgi:hypothetical protein
MTYAAKTSVPVARTRVEIEELLKKYKASRLGFILENDHASIGFTIEGWSVRFKLPIPTEVEAKKEAKRGRYNWQPPPQENIQRWLDQASRERWRALLLTIKAKLVSVENRVETFEEAFMAHLVMRGGVTVGEEYLPSFRTDLKQLPPGATG